MILCDIGNSSYHFFDTEQKTNFKIFDDEKLPKIEERVYFASVNEKKTEVFIQRFPNCINLEQFCEFETSYEGMGFDRKLACTTCNNGLIVDAGSAITVDLMENSVHLGGFILPGIKALIKCYGEISPKLLIDFEKETFLDKIPNSTKNAINYAILKSIILPIGEIASSHKITFTGGDGKILASFFANSIYDEFLIFKGMQQIIEREKC